MTHVIAVDWSGKAKGEAESIWRAVVVDGRLVELENRLERTQVIQWIIDYAKQYEDTVLGLDFAFSFPDWFCSREGWRTGREVWDAMREHADRLLEACEPPLWGRPGTKAQTMGRPLRQTESDVVAHPKSVFQIGGAGAVGTGSLRGMRQLAELADAGFAIWPFDESAQPLVVEIYPRLFAPNVVKNRHRQRREHLHKHFPGQHPALLERAAGSEDAFDAAISALVMAENSSDFDRLPPFAPGSPQRIEGCIWAPEAT